MILFAFDGIRDYRIGRMQGSTLRRADGSNLADKEDFKMRKSIAVVLFAIVLGSVTPALGAELTGTALGCFPDPNYPGPRPPQCIESTGLSMYTETGGPNRDLFYHGSTFDQVGPGSYTLDLGTLTLVGAGIRSTINDVLHLSVNVADQHGEIGIANYIVSASGFAFYDSMRRQSVGQVSLNFGDPEPDNLQHSIRFVLNGVKRSANTSSPNHSRWHIEWICLVRHYCQSELASFFAIGDT